MDKNFRIFRCFRNIKEKIQENPHWLWKRKWMHLNILFLLIYFNYRLITLQYCGGFATHWHESATGVHVSPIPNPPPTSLPIPYLWVSLCTSFGCPVSCIKLGSVIYFTYGNIHVSMLFSQIIPPPPSPTESKSLFFISESLLLSANTESSLPSF